MIELIDAGADINAKASIRQTTMNNEKVESCILRQFNKMRFSPAPDKEWQVVYPFRFETSH